MIYIVAFTLRSGSSHLCEMMRSVGVMGFPFEHYTPVDFKKRTQERGIEAKNPIGYFLEIIERSRGGLCGFKMNWDSFAVFVQETEPLFNHLQIRYIYLTRRDRVAQAVSWVIADQTNIWSNFDGPSCVKPRYDRAAILDRLEIIKAHEDRWEHWFRTINADPLRLVYESIDSETIGEIGRFLGVNTEAVKPRSDFRKQADQINMDWIERFRNESRNI